MQDKDCFIAIKGVLASPQSLKSIMTEEMGKKMNIEVRKLIKSNKVRYSINKFHIGEATFL